MALVQPSSPEPLEPAAVVGVRGLGDVRVLGQRRHAELVEHAVDPLERLLRHHLLQLGQQRAGVLEAGTDVRRRDHDVDAVRLAVDVLVDPLQLELELLGRERERAEHADATGVRHRGHDIAAVAEREDRELDPEPLAQFVVHECFPFPLRGPLGPRLTPRHAMRRVAVVRLSYFWPAVATFFAHG